MRVLIAYNEPVLPPTHPEADSENDVLEAVDAIAGELEIQGITLIRAGVGRDFEAFLATLRDWRPDAVLNLFEGFGDDPNSECRFASMLEAAGVAFTGCSSETLWHGGRKDIAKRILEQAGIATPRWTVVENVPSGELRLNWPIIVKPAFRDASVGIHAANVVTDVVQLEERVSQTAAQYGLPVLVEEFVGGREVSAAVIDAPELVVLPLVETVFTGEKGTWAIDSYAAKWQPQSDDHLQRDFRFPAELAPELSNRVATMARKAYRVLGCRGLVTIDFRIRGDEPYVLEVNPNADLNPTGYLTELFCGAGLEYGEFLMHMIRDARERRH